jgi:Glycosyl hydrolases family 2, TIM barrel domain
VVERVRAVRNHPAILMWAVGNEWNYNGLYVGLSQEDSVDRLNQAAALIKAEDPLHPVATIYGELPSPDTLAAMPAIDVWGINAYRGISFGDLFESWRERSSAPMFISEYGADAYNANLPSYDPDSQAEAVSALTREIFSNAAPEGVTLGGTLFEWADEWWKDPAGSLSEQEVGGVAPGGGPYPDQVFNEEWWGIVDIQRAIRPAFTALREVYVEAGAP